MSGYAIAEFDRRIGNILSVGVVTDVSGDGTARVRIGDLDTASIPVGALRAGGMQVWWMPTVGEQVVVAAPSGDMARAVVLCSILAGNAPSGDVAVPMIDLRGGDMVIKGGKLIIEADLDITGKMDITGDVASQANMTAAGGIGAGGAPAAPGEMKTTGNITTDGNVEAAGDVKAGSTTLTTHTHPGDSGGTTGVPS